MPYRKLQPSGDHILIQYADSSRAVASVSNARKPKRKRATAKVIAIGPGKKGADGNRVPLGLKVGERILVDRSRGIGIRLNQRSYVVIRQQDLVESHA
jgi:chaperonin GroES